MRVPITGIWGGGIITVEDPSKIYYTLDYLFKDLYEFNISVRMGI
jgi:hypothetical protein